MIITYPYGDFPLSSKDATSSEDLLFVTYNGDIYDTGVDLMIYQVSTELSTAKYKGIIFHIVSRGGELTQGLRAGNFLRELKIPLVTYAPAGVQSAALPLLFAGTLTGGAPETTLGFHRARTRTNLFNVTEDELAFHGLRTTKKLQDFITDETKADSTMTEGLLRQETITTLTAADAQRYGYIDFVEILQIPQNGRRIEIIAGQNSTPKVYFK